MESHSRPIILLVEDEPRAVAVTSFHLQHRYDVVTASSSGAALDLLRAHPAVSVIVAEVGASGLDGAHFLSVARSIAPDAVRIALASASDCSAAVAAINEGQVFRILTEPCSIGTLSAAIDAAVAQYRLVTAERELLEKTLHGSIKTLTDIVSLIDPLSFGRATRVKRLVSELAQKLDLKERWQVEVAAMLSQLACLTLPDETVEKMHHGEDLSEAELAMIARLPAVNEQLLGNIPRLEDVREILATYARPFHRSDPPGHDAGKHRMERWRQILHVAIDFDVLEAQGVLSGVAIDTLRGRFGRYDPQVIEALVAVRGRTTLRHEVRELTMRALAPGMVFTQDLRLANGTLLVGRGGEVTAGLLARIRNFKPGSVKEPVRMRVRISG